MPVYLQVKICCAANPLSFSSAMLCSQQHPIGFIVLRKNIRNGRICYSPVQQLYASVNHRMVHRVRPTAKIFTDFTSIDFRGAKLSRLCTARYGKVSLCTLLYAGFAYQPPIQQQMPCNASRCAQAKAVFKNGVKNSRTECTVCTAILKSSSHFQYGSGLTTSTPIKPRTRLPPTWTLLVASTLYSRSFCASSELTRLADMGFCALSSHHLV